MKKRAGMAVVLAALIFLSLPGVLSAYEPLVEKKAFELKEFVTVGGQRIAPVRVGYETYGKLNASRDNVILICHFFGGTSHAAGRYAATDKAPGYWDVLVGPGKVFDTDKYFIISIDTLNNLNAKNPTVITTGPATVNPSTGKPYGMSFPIVTIRDFVRVQYELLKSLGIRKLKCVTGASMGGMQAVEWAVAYPDVVEKIVPVIAGPQAQAWLIGWMKVWAEAVKQDPKWNGGDYYGREEPIDGIAFSNKIMLMTIFSPWWSDRNFGRKWADEGKSPYDAMDNKFLMEQFLDKTATAWAGTVDANSIIYMAKAVELHDIGYGIGSYGEALKRIKAKVLMVPSQTDILVYPYNVRQFVEAVNKAGGRASVFEIPSWEGHMGGIAADILKAEIDIRAFLAR